MNGLKPLSSPVMPKYPLKKEVLQNPYIFQLPERWKKNTIAGAATTLALSLVLAGCAVKPPSDVPPSPAQSKRLNIPFFTHGEGRGSFGCVSVAPAVYFTEEEAYEVISDTAKQYGFSFADTQKEVKTTIPKTAILPNGLQNEDLKKTGMKIQDEPGVLKLDGYNTDKNIGFEFVSVQDIKDWAINPGFGASVEDYYTKEAAQKLSASLSKGDMPAAVFYEPFAQIKETAEKYREYSEDNFSKMEAELKEKNLEALKAQVADFMEWLKSEGII